MGIKCVNPEEHTVLKSFEIKLLLNNNLLIINILNYFNILQLLVSMIKQKKRIENKQVVVAAVYLPTRGPLKKLKWRTTHLGDGRSLMKIICFRAEQVLTLWWNGRGRGQCA